VRRALALAAFLALAGCPGACPPPQVRYPSGVTGMVCDSCLTGSRCDPGLLPAEQVDAAVTLVAQTLVADGKVPAAFAAKGLSVLHVCLVDTAGMQVCPGGTCWAHGPCTTLDQPGTCLAGQYAADAVKVTVRDPQGVRLRVWQTALAHETCHHLGLMEGDYMSSVISRVNAELQRRWP
jgi:hypothetical protein